MSFGNLGGVGKDGGRAGDPSRKPAGDAGDLGLAAGDDPTMQFDDRSLAEGRRRGGEAAHPL
jgi:hypothetical protein